MTTQPRKVLVGVYPVIADMILDHQVIEQLREPRDGVSDLGTVIRSEAGL